MEEFNRTDPFSISIWVKKIRIPRKKKKALMKKFIFNNSNPNIEYSNLEAYLVNGKINIQVTEKNKSNKFLKIRLWKS